MNRFRVEYAKELMLTDAEKKMTVVADESGFSSEQSFYRNFRKHAGMTPSQWRDQLALHQV